MSTSVADKSKTLPSAPAEVAAAPQSWCEREIKLEGDPASLDAAFASLLAGDDTKAPAKNLVSTYFDTLACTLLSHGYVLRVRKSQGRFVQTLKWDAGGALGPDARNEIDVRCREETPEIGLFGAAIALRIETETGGAPLFPRFSTQIRRRSLIVNTGPTRIEAALDTGNIVDGDAKVPVREIELELKEGDPANLYAFAEQLAAAYNLRLGVLTKSQRGYLLAAQENVEIRRAKAPLLETHARLDDLIAAALTECVDHFVLNWPALLQSDNPDAIHQMRVAMRRLRALLKVLHRETPHPRFEGFRKEAGEIAMALGTARDTDVFIHMAERGPFETHNDDASTSAFMLAASERREEGYGQAHAMLAAPQTTRFVLELRGFVARRGWQEELATEHLIALGEPAQRFAARTLKRLDKKARKMGRSLEEASPEERHELRIVLKGIRYAAEIFAPLFDRPAEAKKFGRAVATLQDVLGIYNDASVAADIVEDIERRAGSKCAHAAGIVIGWTKRGLAGAGDHVIDIFKDYRKADRFWE